MSCATVSERLVVAASFMTMPVCRIAFNASFADESVLYMPYQ